MVGATDETDGDADEHARRQQTRPHATRPRRAEPHVADSGLSTRAKIALTCRALFDAGHDSGLAGQITARAERPGTYYTQQLGLGFDEITEDNLLLVDEDLNVLGFYTGMANPANRFHSWIYRGRPDVNCIVHTHLFHVAALSMLEVPLIVSHMDATPLYDDCAFLKDWPGVPVGNEEGEIITAALGDKKAVLLAHHGHVIAGCQRGGGLLAGHADRTGGQTTAGRHGRGHHRRTAAATGPRGPRLDADPQAQPGQFRLLRLRRALARHPDALSH